MSMKNENRIELLKDVISNKKVRTLFQPIVSLSDGEVFGYEALSRGPENSLLQNADILFSSAAEYNLSWDLEYLCREQALLKFSLTGSTSYLFINVDPYVIKEMKFRNGFTKEFINKHNMDPEKIIFEITEKNAVVDYPSFKESVNHYSNQGFKIAMDDIGSAYSGLRMMTEINPHFLKIDMEIIRDIDKKKLNRILLKTLVDFAASTNMRVIAEGIETREELDVLIGTGVEFGQGYFLSLPDEKLDKVCEITKNYIKSAYNRRLKKIELHTGNTPVSDICKYIKTVTSKALGKDVYAIFKNDDSISGIPVVADDIPIGLIMKNSFYYQLASPYGYSLFMKRTVENIMNEKPMIVDKSASLTQVSNIATYRKNNCLYDDIIVSEHGKYLGIITVRQLLEHTTELEKRKLESSNPLTGLPGNRIIELNLSKVLLTKEDCYIIYFDLDNFKAYNDTYGFENGDKVIKLTADLLEEKIFEYGRNNFIGHIGGDDFVAIIVTNEIDSFCKNVISCFDRRIKDLYRIEDVINGYIESKDRHGKPERFPLVSISVAVACNSGAQFPDTRYLGEHLSKLKKKCKLEWVSNYVIG